MELEQIKSNMYIINQVLEKTNIEIKLDIVKAENAQSKLIRRYKQAALGCIMISAVFFMTWLGGVDEAAFSFPYRLVIAIYTLCASLWYFYLTIRLKSIDIVTLSPAKVITETSSLKLMALSGEIFSVILLVVFFTLFLPQLFYNTLLGFWLCMATLIVAIIFSLIYFIPKYVRLFQELNSIKE